MDSLKGPCSYIDERLELNPYEQSPDAVGKVSLPMDPAQARARGLGGS